MELKELESLKNKLFNNNQSDEEQVYEFRLVMREVGGFEQVMKLPVDVYRLLVENIVWERKQLNKSLKNHAKP